MFLFSSLGCARLFDPSLSWNPAPHSYVDPDLKAQAEFNSRAQVSEFAELGLRLKCETKICSSIDQTSLETISRHKKQFASLAPKIETVYLVKENYPVFDHGTHTVYIQKNVTDSDLNNFFQLIQDVNAFEKQVGFDIDFSTAFLQEQVQPVLQLLEKHKAELASESNRFKYLRINSQFNHFDPIRAELDLRYSDLENFEPQWQFIRKLFKAEDLFGKIEFKMDWVPHEVESLDIFIENASIFAKLLSLAKIRSVTFYPEQIYDTYSYRDDRLTLFSGDFAYFDGALKNIIHLQKISSELQNKVSFGNGLVLDFELAEKCLMRVENLRSSISEKIAGLSAVYISFDEINQPTSFKNTQLTLSCSDSDQTWQSTISQVPN